MPNNDHISDEVVKIFHNSKGSIKKNLEKWVNHTDEIKEDDKVNLNWDSNADSQHNHAAGEYEPLQERNTFTLSSEQNESKSKESPPSKSEVDGQIDEENRSMLENEMRQDKIEDMRSEYRGHIGDKR